MYIRTVLGITKTALAVMGVGFLLSFPIQNFIDPANGQEMIESIKDKEYSKFLDLYGNYVKIYKDPVSKCEYLIFGKANGGLASEPRRNSKGEIVCENKKKELKAPFLKTRFKNYYTI
jgi:hypothetical protein